MSDTHRIVVKLTPGASKNEVIGWETDLFGEKRLKACVTAIPEKGKANKALIQLLSKHYGIAKSCFTIIRGETSREKTIEIQGVTAADLYCTSSGC